MSPRLTRQAPSPSRVLSLLTAAILMAGTAPLMAATATVVYVTQKREYRSRTLHRLQQHA